MEWLDQIPQALADGLEYIIPMCRDIVTPILPFAMAVAEVFLVVDIAVSKLRAWVLDEPEKGARHSGYYNDWDF